MESPSEAPHSGDSPWKWFLITASIFSFWIQSRFVQGDLITVVPNPPYGIVGSSITLTIQGFLGNPLSYNWYKKTTEPSNRLVTYQLPSGVQIPADIRHKVLPNGSMIITKLTPTDTDDYIVQIVDSYGFIDVIARGHLTVFEKLVKPNITLNNTILKENDTLVLICGRENKGANILWFFNDQLLPLNERMNITKNNQTIIIMSVKREDTGSYQCETRNPISANRSNPLNVTVNYGPDHIKILPSTESGEVVVQLNDSLTLECQTQSYPPAQYEWNVNNTSGPIHSGSTFTIVHAYWNPSGRYTCWARNNVTKLSVSKDITIKVVAGDNGSSLSERDIVVIVIAIFAGVIVIGYFFLFFRKS